MICFIKDHRGLDWYLPCIELKLEELHQECLNAEQTYHAGMSESRVLEMFEDVKLRAEDALNLAKQAFAAQKSAAVEHLYLLN